MKRNTMDNGATVLDILGGDNYIGLGRSSLSGQSLSGIFMNMKEKVLAWKPDVIRLWNFPSARLPSATLAQVCRCCCGYLTSA